MPRTFSRNSRSYDPGVYGPFSLNQITRDDTDAIRGTFTVENWDTTVDPLLTVSGSWSDGTNFGATFGGVIVNRDGTPAATVAFEAHVPRVTDASGNAVKVVVASGEVSMQCHAALQTAITLEAVQFEVQAAATPRGGAQTA